MTTGATLTTIAYRDGVLAGDTLVTAGDEKVGYEKKLHRLKDGRLYAWAGDYRQGLSVLQNLKDGKPLLEPGEECEIDAVLIHPGGLVETVQGGKFTKETFPFVALGSGAKYATGAMEMGATAKQAVQIGIKRDTSSGGRIHTLTLKGTNAGSNAATHPRRRKGRNAAPDCGAADTVPAPGAHEVPGGHQEPSGQPASAPGHDNPVAGDVH